MPLEGYIAVSYHHQYVTRFELDVVYHNIITYNHEIGMYRIQAIVFIPKYNKLIRDALILLAKLLEYIQQYRMVKGRVPSPKCLFHVATQIE